jgi:trans-aconitate 3-methyltransferase
MASATNSNPPTNTSTTSPNAPPSTSTSTDTDIWNSLASSTLSWSTYARGRPPVPPSFWSRITTYHRTHGNGSFNCVHDLGAGPGLHSPALAKFFDSVTVSDPNEANIAAARTQLGALDNAAQFTARVGKGEDDAGTEVFDLVWMGNSLHWAEPRGLMASVARSLKPAGTMAAALFGIPTMMDAEANEVLLRRFRGAIEEVWGQKRFPNFEYSVVLQGGRYVGVEMDEGVWRDVQRVFLNMKPEERIEVVPEQLLQAYEGEFSAIRPSDKVVVEEKDEDWYLTTDLDGLRDVMGSFPFPQAEEAEEKMWRDLERIYKSRPVEIRYAVGLVLATRK